jgi:hypothetical protein
MLFSSESPIEPADREFTSATNLQQAIEEATSSPDSLHEPLHRLLQDCNWQVLLNEAVELVVHCPNSKTRTQIINQLLDLSILLNKLYGATKIRILSSSYPLTTTTDRVMHYYRFAQYCGHPESKDG